MSRPGLLSMLPTGSATSAASRQAANRNPRSRILPFFPAAPGNAPPGRKCPTCRRDNSPSAERCRYCRAPLSARQALRNPATRGRLARVLLICLGIVLVVSLYAVVRPVSPARSGPKSEVRAVPKPIPVPTLGTFAMGAGTMETGATWVIYSSLDRLTDEPLFGARFGNQTGAHLINILCAKGRGTLSLERGLFSPPDAASGNGKKVTEEIDVNQRFSRREKQRLDLRFDEQPAESLEVTPAQPAAFLRRVASSRRIRTATDEFDTRDLGPFVDRVMTACGFDDRT